MPEQSSVVIVSPAAAAANNGNARTAERWQLLLQPDCRVRVVRAWPDADAHGDVVMLALHARRSADAIAAWHSARGPHGLAVVLTGTDLYQDLARDARAQASVDAAARVVVLQERGVDALAPAVRPKARVIFQSTPAASAVDKPADRLVAIAVGHMRAVKSPQTLFEVASLLRDRDDIVLEHIGGEEEPGWIDRARATAGAARNYRWLGTLPHGQTLRRIAAAHLLVHPSALEGGAHAILEAVRCGTPVLASRVPGNVGMLGADYRGYFPHGDAHALADMLSACRASQGDPAGGMLAHLRAQCATRDGLFAPEAERAALLSLIHELQSTP